MLRKYAIEKTSSIRPDKTYWNLTDIESKYDVLKIHTNDD